MQQKAKNCKVDTIFKTADRSGEKVARDKKNAGLNRIFGRDIDFSKLFFKSSRPFRTLSVFLINSTEKRLMIKKIGEIETHQTLYFIVFYPNYYGHNVSLYSKKFLHQTSQKGMWVSFFKNSLGSNCHNFQNITFLNII